MCSLGDDNIDGDEASKYMPEIEEFEFKDKKCIKCKDADSCLVLRTKDAYCKECFLSATTHKFKSLLGKSHLIYPKDNVLVLHKGGHSSTALLHFLRTGLDLSTPKKLRFNPIFIFIDNNFKLPIEQRKIIIDKIHKEVVAYNFKIYFISFIEYILNPNNIKELLIEDPNKLILNNIDNFNSVIKEKTSETNKSDILNIFERQLLLDASKSLDCKSAFTPELGIDIASLLLTNVSLGRGIHLPLDTSICDNRDPYVKIIRPLRLFEMNELIYYNKFNELEPIMMETPKEDQYASVQNLMKNFVGNLQANFPATITTIVRTGDKLAMDEALAKNEKCILCKGPKETVMTNLSSGESTNFSHWVSTQTPKYELNRIERYNQTLDSFINSQTSKYCFSCNRISNNIL